MAIVEINYQRDPASGAVEFDIFGNPLVITNTSANTFGQLKARVLNETLGAASIDDAGQAVLDAISEYQSMDFWFNEMRYFGSPGSASNLVTVAGQEFYSAQDLAVLTNMPHIRQISVLAFQNRYPLVERTQQWIDDVSTSPTWQGLPTDWCWVANAIRIYPIPDNAYPLILTGTIRFHPLLTDNDYNVWTNRGEWLIRTEAKRLLFTNINRDPDQAQLMELELLGNPQTGRQGALAQLRRETMRRAGGTGRIRASRSYL